MPQYQWSQIHFRFWHTPTYRQDEIFVFYSKGVKYP